MIRQLAYSVLFAIGLFYLTSPTFAQSEKQGPVSLLFVMNSNGAILQDGKLTLTGVAPNLIVFTDRPVRSANHILTSRFLEEWAPDNTDPESFHQDPPNATVSAFSKSGETIKNAVVVMKTAQIEGDSVMFEVEVLEGDLSGADGSAAIFVDSMFGRAMTTFHGENPIDLNHECRSGICRQKRN